MAAKKLQAASNRKVRATHTTVQYYGTRKQIKHTLRHSFVCSKFLDTAPDHYNTATVQSDLLD